MPAVEIARTYHIPLSSVYKKIRKLKDLEMLDIDKIEIDSRSGKKIAYYRCTVKSLELSLTGDDAKLGIETRIPKTGTADAGKTRSGLR